MDDGTSYYQPPDRRDGASYYYYQPPDWLDGTSYYQPPDRRDWPDRQLRRAGWKKVIAVLNMYQNPLLIFVANLILLEWPIVCLQEVREFSHLISS